MHAYIYENTHSEYKIDMHYLSVSVSDVFNFWQISYLLFNFFQEYCIWNGSRLSYQILSKSYFITALR